MQNLLIKCDFCSKFVFIFETMSENIIIQGARVNNLKNVSVNIPRNSLVVITGLSGSGKSSLAFDTLYAEGQRRYVESLSSYARQFLGRMSKPECDFIKGLPPAIAIEQRVNTKNSRSTVGTSTEIYDYLRMLFSRIGKTYSPISGQIVKRHTAADVISCIKSYPIGTRYAILTKLIIPENRDFETHLSVLLKGGYSRLYKDGEFYQIADIKLTDDMNNYFLLIDRMSVSDNIADEMRVRDSLETAFFEGSGECCVVFWTEGEIKNHSFSKRFEADGISFEEPNDLMFNFNNPIGACSTCEGFGKVIGIDENLVIPNRSLSIYDDAVLCWRGQVMGEWKQDFIRQASRHKFPIHKPYFELTQSQKDYLWHGDENFPGIDGFFRYIQSKSYNIQYRVLLVRYRGKTVCPDCLGTRLKKQAEYVKINGATIGDLVKLPISNLYEWFNNLELNETDKKIAERLLVELKSRIGFIVKVGLGYLTLDRLSSTLSGGESQRINLTTSLGSSLVGSIYILDEPSIGLHSRDTDKLINVLRMLQNAGNTVVVVEHDEDIITKADWLIDMGPEAGRNGGNVVYEGLPCNKDVNSESYTIKYLIGALKIDVPEYRRPWRNYIEVQGAFENNLKNINVKFPLGVMTVVTGVSGSGKSTLVNQILYQAVARMLGENVEAPGGMSGISGDTDKISKVVMVDQNPIGKSSRSNAATYLKAYDEIRKLFSEQQLSVQMGYNAGYFSFNAPGGRCEDCKGEGSITVEMQFMADINLECEACHGKRYGANALEVEYKGKNIYDVLEMTVNQAIDFFEQAQNSTEKKIVKRLKPLQDVGLGYIKLGQSSATLSGGENQRVKLAYYLSEEKNAPTMFIFDEPTTGLHFHDIKTLQKALNQLISRGHTVIIIEHNMDIIKCADYIIDLGPEGGDEGGNVVITGTPEQVAMCEKSYTGKYLREKLG